MMALIVLVISFTAAMTVYLTLLQGDAFPLRTKAQTLLQTVFEEARQEQRYLDETLERDGLRIKKSVFLYEAYQTSLQHQQVYQMTLEAYGPKQRVIATTHHLIQVSYEQ